MKNKQKWILILLVLAVLGAGAYVALNRFGLIPGAKPNTSQVKNPEFAKMAVIIERYKTADLEVIVDGYHKKPAEFLSFARQYLIRRFDAKMDAETWVKTYAYRSKAGEIIYFKYPDGSTKPMRDVFLEELKKPDTAQK